MAISSQTTGSWIVVQDFSYYETSFVSLMIKIKTKDIAGVFRRADSKERLQWRGVYREASRNTGYKTCMSFSLNQAPRGQKNSLFHGLD